jgi:NAD(P)-dependent dehydrogenase (short-subunit alcohol dehydrogenase family)
VIQFIGAGKGIGEATAKLLAFHGASVVLCDLDGDSVEKVAELIRV